MTSRYQDNFLNSSSKSPRHGSSSTESSTATPHHQATSNTSAQKKAKWYNPANLLKISPEPVNPWASNPFTSTSSPGKEESRRASVRLHDQRRGYLGPQKIVGYYKP
jgi:hypothetical protein